jgi:hypothetical protein
VVKGRKSNPWRQLRPLPAAPLVVRRRYLIEVPRPLPAPFAVRNRYIMVVLWPLPPCASRVLDRDAHADARGAMQVLDRRAQAVARFEVACQRYLAVVLRPLPERPFPVRRRCLILMTRPLPAALLAVRSFNAAWQAALGQCAPSPLACRHTYSPGRAAGGPHRGSVPQAQGGPRHHCEC